MSSVVFCGIDYSLTSPAICVIDADNGTIGLHGFASSKKLEGFYRQGKFQITLDVYPSWSIPQERYSLLSEWVLGYLPDDVSHIVIEGYSFASKSGLICDIAENGAILKHRLWKRNLAFSTLPPTSLKKFATGKGNADKTVMHETFKNECFDLQGFLGIKSEKIGNPVSDLVDAFYLAKFCQTEFS